VYAQLSTPLMWRFLQEVPEQSDAWAAEMVDRLTGLCGQHLQALWKIRLNATEAPALRGWLATGTARLGDLMRSPEDRDEPLHAVPLLVMRGDEWELAPDDGFVLAPDDEVLLVGWPSARRSLDTTLVVDATREYVVTGRHVPTSWIWRKFTASRAA
jgi:voltage-gated potassium channel